MIRRKHFTLPLAAILGLGMVACVCNTRADEAADLPPPAGKKGVSFKTDIHPIFEGACIDCHGPEKQKGKLRLDTREFTLEGARGEAVVIAGDSAKSKLVLTVAHATEDQDLWMPKGKDAKKLTDEQIGLIRAWIDQGAK